MKDIDKKEILKLISQYSNLEESTSAATLHKYLKRNGVNSISLPTISKYKTLLLTKKNLYDQKIGIKTNSYDEIINEIVNELSRNRKKEAERATYKKMINAELDKYKSKLGNKLLENQNCISKQNKILKDVKKEICSKLQDIPPKTLNYLYNKIAKEKGLLPKRSTINTELINKIENLFKDGSIQKYILDNQDDSTSTLKLIQIYIEKTCNVKLSIPLIRRHFNKYYKTINLALMYKMFGA